MGNCGTDCIRSSIFECLSFTDFARELIQRTRSLAMSDVSKWLESGRVQSRCLDTDLFSFGPIFTRDQFHPADVMNCLLDEEERFVAFEQCRSHLRSDTMRVSSARFPAILHSLSRVIAKRKIVYIYIQLYNHTPYWNFKLETPFSSRFC